MQRDIETVEYKYIGHIYTISLPYDTCMEGSKPYVCSVDQRLKGNVVENHFPSLSRLFMEIRGFFFLCVETTSTYKAYIRAGI